MSKSDVRNEANSDWKRWQSVSWQWAELAHLQRLQDTTGVVAALAEVLCFVGRRHCDQKAALVGGAREARERKTPDLSGK